MRMYTEPHHSFPVHFHNTVELDEAPGGGVLLRRYPRAVREAMGPLGRLVSEESSGCEIRFVAEAPNIRIALSAMPGALAPNEEHRLDLVIFQGAFFHSHIRLTPGQVNYINLTDIGQLVANGYASLKSNARDTDYFPQRVWRILFGRYPAVFHDVHTFGYPIRPPREDEMPRRRLLCYGSSITHGAAATLYHLCYVQQAARRLKVDALNLGLSGSCRCEPEVADDLAARPDWDMITLELGVNMRAEFSTDTFKERAHALIQKMADAHPDKPVVVITIYPNAQSCKNALDDTSEAVRKQEGFSDALRNIVKTLDRPHVRLIEGSDILTDYGGMAKDLIHPGDYGHIEMGWNLAEKIKPWIEK